MTSAPSRRNLAFESLPVPSWHGRPFHIANLLDMLRFYAALFNNSLASLERYERRLKALCDEGRSNDVMPQKEKVEYVSATYLVLELCEELQLKQPLRRKTRIYTGLSSKRSRPSHYQKAAKMTFARAHREIAELADSVRDELAERLFLRVPTGLEGYYYEEPAKKSTVTSQLDEPKYKPLFDDETKPLEQRFSQRWPNANKEVVAAGNCYATGNSTASVFHLMRAVEYGARTLASELKLEVGKDKDIPKPVKKCDWGHLAIGFGKAIRRLPRQTEDEDRLVTFYNDVTAHFSAVKDLRNRICHTRGRYNQRQARIVFDNVEHFMNRLSENLCEAVDEADQDTDNTSL